MDLFEQQSRGRESQMQGRRPSPLQLHKNSHKINKPTPVTATAGQRRPPMIIYTVSPKVIHAEPGEFRSLVQRLTGCCSGDGKVSPVEKRAAAEAVGGMASGISCDSGAAEKFVDGGESPAFGKMSFQGPNFVGDPSSSNYLGCPSVVDIMNSAGFLQQELSPVLYGNKGFMEMLDRLTW